MRFPRWMCVAALAAAMVASSAIAAAGSGAPAVAPVAEAVVEEDPAPPETPTAPEGPLPGTDAEARDYERREAAAPEEILEFTGGHAGISISASLLVLALLVLLIVYLSKPEALTP